MKIFKRICKCCLVVVFLIFAVLYGLFLRDPLYEGKRNSFITYIYEKQGLWFQDPTGEAANMASLMYHNIGSDEYAEYWAFKAANKGYARAMVNVGRICFQKNQIEEAMKWFGKAAKNGYECEEYKMFMAPVTMEEIDKMRKETEERYKRLNELKATEHNGF